MKNKHKYIIIAVVVAVLVLTAITITLFSLNNMNKLTMGEKKWVNNNTGKVYSINVVNDVNVFGQDGSGVFYDYINDFAKNYNLTINVNTTSSKSNTTQINLNVKNTINDDDIVFYKDHYVLVGKNEESFASITDFKDKKIGTLNNYEEYVSSYLDDISLITYENKDALLKAFESGTDINYILVPENEFIDKILEKNYNIVFHNSDINEYYVLDGVENDTLSDIMIKYFNSWKDDYLKEYINEHTLAIFLDKLNITKSDYDVLTSKVYNYGFIENHPYEILMSGNYGGIVSTYLKEFTDFSKVEYKFTKYRSIKTIEKAIKNNNVDLYFDYFKHENSFENINTMLNVKYYIITKNGKELEANSKLSLTNKTVYVLRNSEVYDYLKDVPNINIKTYSTHSEMIKLCDKNIVVVDANVYDYYKLSSLKDMSIRYAETISSTYDFKINGDATLKKLFEKYINYLDNHVVVHDGLYNHSLTLKNGTILGTIAKYSLYIIGLGLVISLFIYKSSKKIKIAKKIRKEDKIRFIDQLTSLKNRNYLNECLDSWNKNTIYPQAAVIIDLNNIQYINDTYGYEEGDKQIKAAANVLIKTQVDNTDIMRTDGNEFMVYLVGYQSKQVVSYIRKLRKEFRNLPYEFGTAIGYSMINDDIKLIEDAINEATNEMKKEKEIAGE